MRNFEELLYIVEERISQLELDKSPKELYEPIAYILDNKGKRIRPVLTLMACQMFSENIDKAIDAAVGLEVFHNFTLLHDDIMDNAPIRRGKPSVHEQWSPNTAILSGDAMMVEAYKLMLKAPDFCLREVLDVFSNIALGVCEGQMYDMQFETRSEVTEAEYLEMIRLKTSVLLAACLKTGALIGEASIKEANLVYDFGLYLGLAFQLKDDWLDVYGNPELFGKKNGGDIVVNKKTFLLIKALELANPKQKEELEKWLSETTFDETEKVEAVKTIYEALNISGITLDKAKFFSEKAFKCLEQVNVPKEKKQALTELGNKLLNRDK